ncbi:hypothetical protein CS062_12180 [Roseateles chitinivorans]|uniref:Uncharacterized protein n=1 Tax=Roseateles chitinivorans TaxID=2917965 RepID=A0A2G9C9C4_9BURK|nr:hypothetical protein [Roseateles chitinivorans]PIM52975.1 hypothetical protein CS062_12180 [Roseateles chitinivorans]
MSARLAQFDSLLTRRRTARAAAAPAQPLRTLCDPWGEPVAEFSRFPSDLELLKAAHRLQADDWIGPLADDAQPRRLSAVWRLALLRADRHGQARVSREPGPQWISPLLTARPGERPGVLRRELHAAAVRQLWQAGWKLVG